MPLPTLLQKGKILIPKHFSEHEKQRIQKISGLDYIMEFLDKRISLKKNVYPILRAKSISDKILILKSGTGSGKSTAFIEAMYDAYFSLTHKSIAVTQPRILTARDIPYDIIKRRKDLIMGDTIGYQTGIISKRPNKGISFMTEGVLLHQLQTYEAEKFRKKYMILVIDEIHTRNIYVDMLLIRIKNFLQENYDEPDCPFLIMMSATIDPTSYLSYFGIAKSDYNKTKHFIEVLGTSYPIQEHWPSIDIVNYPDYIIELAKTIHQDNIKELEPDEYGNILKTVDILIFAPSTKIIKMIINGFNQYNDKIENQNSEQKKYICPVTLTKAAFEKMGKDFINLFADISTVTINLSNGKVVTPFRRIIVATNIAETGITLPTLQYVIISGWVNSVEFIANIGHPLIYHKPLTKFEVQQQKGRVGRVYNGEVYYCFSEETYHDTIDSLYPNIINNDIGVNLLDIIYNQTNTTINEDVYQQKREMSSVDIHNEFKDRQVIPPELITQSKHVDLLNLDLLTYPPIDNINYSLEKLHILGFIDHEYNITLTGLLSIQLKKYKLENIKMILSGYHYKCNILDLITIAAFIEIGQYIDGPPHLYKRRNVFNITDKISYLNYRFLLQDDFTEYIFIWNEFMERTEKGDIGKGDKSRIKISINYIKNWCLDNYLNYDSLLSIGQKRNEIIETLINIGLNPYISGLDVPMGSYNLNNILKNSMVDGINEVIKIKKAIYEGYKYNICTYNDMLHQYILDRQQLPIIIQSPLIQYLPATKEIKQFIPKKIVISGMVCKSRPRDKGKYKYIAAGAVSVLDGFIDMDHSFFNSL